MTISTFVCKVLSLLFIITHCLGLSLLSFQEVGSFSFTAAVTVCSDFGAQESQICHCFLCGMLAPKHLSRGVKKPQDASGPALAPCPVFPAEAQTPVAGGRAPQVGPEACAPSRVCPRLAHRLLASASAPLWLGRAVLATGPQRLPGLLLLQPLPV